MPCFSKVVAQIGLIGSSSSARLIAQPGTPAATRLAELSSDPIRLKDFSKILIVRQPAEQ